MNHAEACFPQNEIARFIRDYFAIFIGTFHSFLITGISIITDLNYIWKPTDLKTVYLKLKLQSY